MKQAFAKQVNKNCSRNPILRFHRFTDPVFHSAQGKCFLRPVQTHHKDHWTHRLCSSGYNLPNYLFWYFTDVVTASDSYIKSTQLDIATPK